MKKVLIVGGGTAGTVAALELAEKGIGSIIIERSGSVGGKASQLCCKGVSRCLRCDVCLSVNAQRSTSTSTLITVHTNATVTSVKGSPGMFRVGISKASPEAGETIEEEVMVGAIIVAIGYQPFDASIDPRYGYGANGRVLTAVEVERALLRTGRLPLASLSPAPKSMAIIQCVGSRDERRGAPYCSKVCCKYGLKIAQLVKERDPQLEMTVFFMDWRPYDRGHSELFEWAHRNKGVRIIRSRPAEVMESPESRPVVRYATPQEGVVEEEFDLVMLSVGMLPERGGKELSRILGLPTTPLGFFVPGGAEGVFAAGCCTGPKDIGESVKDGIAAAGKACTFLEGSG